MYLLPPRTEAERLEEMYAFEARAYMGWEEPGNDGVDRTPDSSERLYDAMEREDYSSFDEDGMVR
jgi:hypothetical protein